MAEQMREWGKLLLNYKFALDEISTKLNILNEELQFIQHYNPIEHLKTRIKTPDSIRDKLLRKGYPVTIANASAHIQDIAGVRVICSFSTDVYRIADMISKQKDVTVLEVKDYIAKPKPNGYKSLHLIVQIPIFLTDRSVDVPVEIQIRTIAMDFWASLEHKIYYKFNEQVPSGIVTQLKDAADLISMLDERMFSLNEQVQVQRAEA